jgi:predicted dehydrogenase
LAAGVHVFVEKPPAPDLAALSGLVNVEADASKTIGFVGYNFRFAALIADARDLIGETASLRCLKLRFVAAKPRIPIWECSTVEQAFLYAVGIHAIDLALNMLGPPLAVGASHVALGSDRFSLNVTLGFAGGAQAVLDLGNYSNRFECACELIGDDGRVARVIDLRTLTLSGASAAGVAKVSPKETVQYATPALRGGFAAGGYASALAAFFDAVRTGAPSLSPIRASLPVYKVIEQCLNCIP